MEEPPKVLSTSKASTLYTTPKLGNVDAMLKQLKEEEAKNGQNQEARPLTFDAVKEIWEAYTLQVEQNSIRNLLQSIDLELEGKTILATVSSKLSALY